MTTKKRRLRSVLAQAKADKLKEKKM